MASALSRLDDTSFDVTLELTRECPLNCLICSSNAGDRHPFELTFEKWKEVITDAIEIGATSFLLSGGEPFQHSFYKEVCEFISEKGSNVVIYTSGNILDGNELKSLKVRDLDYLSGLKSLKLIFSLEGSNSRTHDLMTRTKNSFKNTITSIKKSINLGIHTELHVVPTLLNYRELPELVSLAQTIGVSKISILRFVAQGRGKENEHCLKMGIENLRELRTIFNELNQYGGFVRMGSPFNPFLLTETYICSAGWNRMTIRYDGRVVPCEAMKFMADEFDDNDVKINSIKEIWKNSQIFIKARKFHQEINSECKKCDFLSKCGGGCPAQKYLNGDKNDIDPYCSIRIGTLNPLYA